MSKSKDATDNGVSSEKEKEDTQESTKEKTPGTGHASAIEAIAGNVAKNHYEESGLKFPEEDEQEEQEEEETEEKEVKKEEVDDETDEDAEDKEKETEQEEKEDTEQKKIKVKIDGVEQEVTMDEMIRGYQKNAAADKRLEEATRLLQEAKNVKEQKQPSDDTDANDDTKDAGPDIDEIFEDIDAKLVQAIQYGEDADVAEALKEHRTALRKHLGAAKAATINEDEIIEKAVQRIEGKSIWERFRKPVKEGGFEDLTKDPMILKIAEEEVDKLFQGNAPNTWETYVEAGNNARKRLGWKLPTQENETEGKNVIKDKADKADKEAMDKKRDKKRKIDSIDTASASTESTVQEEKPESPSEVIKKMAKSRPGQQLY